MHSYKTLLEGVEQSVRLNQMRKAIVLQNEILTYQEMYDLAKFQAACLLADSKKERLKRVAIFSYRTVTAYVGTLTALVSGAAFVPLNPKFPTDRNISILEQCNPDVIIVDKNSIQELVKISEQIQLTSKVFYPDGDTSIYKNISFIRQDELILNSSKHLPTVTPEDEAYILFTSGSTGKPKGVPIKHKNVCSFLSYNQKQYNITVDDRLSQTFEQTFDLSIFDFFMAWCHGACLYGMRPIDLLSPSKYINENKITVWFSVPSVISLLKKQGFLEKNNFPTLRLSLFCGEPLLENQIVAWVDAAPNSICENLYGPTELTIACSSYRWGKNNRNLVNNEILSIGKLYPHMKYILIGDDGQRVHDEGELCVSSAQMFDGYLSTQKENFSCFIKINEQEPFETYYRTGDRVKVCATGEFLYLGRIDQQVKIQGYRVELGEIEAVLSQIKGVERAFAFCIENKNDLSKKLVYYIVGDVTSDTILQEIRKTLPNYMLPSQIKIEKSIPLNVNGKIDRLFIKAQFFDHNIT